MMSDSTMNNESVAEERPFTCTVCLKTFKRKSDMRSHISGVRHILHEPNNILLENLPVTLPKNWNYGPCRFDTNDSLAIWVYDLRTKDDVVAWVKFYMEENKSKFVCRQIRSIKSGTIIRYQCEHWKDRNRDHKKKKVRGTGCKCAIHFNLSRGLANVKISNLHHNHSLTSAEITSFYKPTEHVKTIFLEMFNNGLRPGKALNCYKNHVKHQALSDTEYIKFSADKSKIPSYDWVRYVYQTHLKKKYGSTKSYEVTEELKIKKADRKCFVNVDNGMHSCNVGCNGAYRKQYFFDNRTDASDLPCLELNKDTKRHLLNLIIGNTSVPENFFNPSNLVLPKIEQPKIEVVKELMQHCETAQSTNVTLIIAKNAQTFEM